MKHFASGGLMIAIVGGDGAGKTTILDGLEQWLSNDFALTRIHMGKPKWSTLTIAVRGILKIGRSLGLYPFMRAEINYSPDKSAQRFPGYPYLIRELCTARDRYLTYQSARRQSTNGSIVIIDRFPLKEVKLMDGPQIERMTKNHPANRFINFLDVWEKKYYQEFSAPDLLITLLVDPDVAVRRKTTETEESVRARSYEIWNVDWTKISAHVINAGCSKDEVLKNVKALVWSHL